MSGPITRTGLARCGTPTAWRRHRDLGEPIDEACRAANSAYIYQLGKDRQCARVRALTRLALLFHEEAAALYLVELAKEPDRGHKARQRARQRARTALGRERSGVFEVLLAEELVKGAEQ